MRRYLVLVVVASITGGCDTGPLDGAAPSAAGTLVVSTATGGGEPDQDGYRLIVDHFTSLILKSTGTAAVDMPPGHHTLRLLGLPRRCSVVPADSLEVVVPLHDTVEVRFSVTCAPPQPGPPDSLGTVRMTVRISAKSAGVIPTAALYEVWYEHYGKWDYGGPLTKLGVLTTNDTLVAELRAGNHTGGGPYWYQFYLKNVFRNCSVQNPARVTITPGDTLDLEFLVTCAP